MNSPIDRMPGVSATYPPPSNAISSEATVACRPLVVASLTVFTASPRPGCILFSRLLFPTPEGPVSAESLPCSQRRSRRTPLPVSALV